jgi:serine phosphatase RsbU (regulator of sigma subunit)
MDLAKEATAVSVGGDLHHVLPMPDGSWLAYVVDAAGKGLPAALMMAALSAKSGSTCIRGGR